MHFGVTACGTLGENSFGGRTIFLASENWQAKNTLNFGQVAMTKLLMPH
jgi:hypothetical protein